MFKNIIFDPDFEGFDGTYAGSPDYSLPEGSCIELKIYVEYLRKNNKKFEELTEEEILMLTEQVKKALKEEE